MKISKDKEMMDELFTRGVGQFIDPDGIFRKKLENNPEKIVIKFGVDPTRPDIHLGHAVVLRKLRQFQNMGCKVVFLIGDITAQIGDPTGKSKIRPEINIDEIQKNMETYLNQVDKILLKDEKLFSWTMNSDWFVSINDIIAPVRSVDIFKEYSQKQYGTETLPENDIYNKSLNWVETRRQRNVIKNYTLINFLAILRHVSHGRLVERDMFQDRIKNREPIFMHEMMYPVIQGIDSDAIYDIYGSCDLEVGGTDQHFNMLVGREVMEMNNKEPQAVLSFKLLEGTDGNAKMSKSLDNYVAITDEPNDMYGKIMSIPDSSICNYFELCTFTPLEEVEEIRKILGVGEVNPKDLKMRLAREVVVIYYGESKADEAQENFINTFQKKEIPDDIEEVKYKDGDLLVDVLFENKVFASKSEWRRLVEEGAVKMLSEEGETKITDFKILATPGVYKIGKRRFIKIV